MRLPRYSQYIDGGIQGIELLPSHWKMSRLGYEAWVRARLGWKGLKAEEYVDDGFVFLSTPNIKGREIDFTCVNFISQERYDESPEIKLSRNDVLLAKDGSTLGTVNVVRNLPRPATVNSSIAVITPGKRLGSIFLYYLFQSEYLKNTIQSLKGGMGVPHLFQEDLNKFRIPLPPLDEQSAIGIFLDVETAKIDALIAEQEKLIVLLAEKRQATISNAVTRGLNPDAPMKDSGAKWLGEVPAHWSVTPLKYLVRLKSGGTPSKDKPEYWGGRIPWASAKDLKVEQLASTADCITSAAIESGAASLVDPGTILVVVRGMILARTFPVVEALVPMAINQDLKAIIPRKRLISSYLAWLLRGSASESLLRLDEAGHGTKALRMEAWTSMKLPVPPIEEQGAIADFLSRETTRLDTLYAEAERAIELLQERRNALIAAAVTGQIDVRQA